MINERLLSLARSSFNKSVDTTSSIRNVREEFKVRVYIKSEKEIKRIIIITTNDMIKRAREINIETTLFTRKNIIAIKRCLDLVTFKVRTKKSKKILKKNDFWTKEMSLNASLREINYNVMIHEVKVKEMLKDIKKDETKTLIKINDCIHLRVTINKMKWLIKNNHKKRYASLIARVISAKITNKLINENVCHEFNIKIT